MEGNEENLVDVSHTETFRPRNLIEIPNKNFLTAELFLPFLSREAGNFCLGILIQIGLHITSGK